MKVKISFTVDVDQKKWAELNGFAYEGSASDVRDDIKSYIKAQVQGAAMIEDAGAEVIWPGV